MKFSLSWLKDHLDTDASPEAIAETLTAIGLEVEDIDFGRAELSVGQQLNSHKATHRTLAGRRPRPASARSSCRTWWRRLSGST